MSRKIWVATSKRKAAIGYDSEQVAKMVDPVKAAEDQVSVSNLHPAEVGEWIRSVASHREFIDLRH